MKRKNLITVAIDSPAAAGAGTQAKLIAKYYNLLHLDTGRIYRFLGKISLDSPEKFNLVYLKKEGIRSVLTLCSESEIKPLEEITNRVIHLEKK